VRSVALHVIALLAVVLTSTLGNVTALTPTQQGPCPTYQTNLIITLVNANPNVITGSGQSVVVTFQVAYEDGTPANLLPETTTFVLTGEKGNEQLQSVPVTPTGTPGTYTYTIAFTEDMINKLGAGTITIAIDTCSCSDGLGNRGPTGTISSDMTLTPADNSHLNISPPPAQQVTYVVPLIIALLLILALILFALRRRRKKK